MSSVFDFARVMETIEAALVDVLALEALPIRPPLAQAHGAMRGMRVELTARAYSSRHVRYARFVTIQGGSVDIGSVLVVPHEDVAAPIFVLDLVCDAPEHGLVLADLVTTTDDADVLAAQHRELARRLPPLVLANALVGLAPADAISVQAHGGSPRALRAWADPAQPSSAADAATAYAGAFAMLARTAPAASSEAAQRAFLRRDHEREPVPRLIATMFGDVFAATFATVLWTD